MKGKCMSQILGHLSFSFFFFFLLTIWFCRALKLSVTWRTDAPMLFLCILHYDTSITAIKCGLLTALFLAVFTDVFSIKLGQSATCHSAMLEWAIWPFSKTSFLLCNIDLKLRATGPVRHFATCHRTQELVLSYQRVLLSALVLYFISVIQWGFFPLCMCTHCSAQAGGYGDRLWCCPCGDRGRSL